MKPIWKFRLFTLVIFLFVGGLSIVNLVAEFLRPAPSPLPSRTSKASTPDQISAASRASAIVPFRADLKVDYALALSGQTLISEHAGRSQNNKTAQDAVTNALKLGPHDSRLWLVLALLQARSNIGDPLVAESLKMSYFTGPGRAEVIPARLDIVTLSDALTDSDLNDLARNDVRATLTQFPDQREALVADFARASSIGKKFLEDNARTLDPKFADSLRNAR